MITSKIFRGFTLIEVTVSLLIIGVMVIVMANATLTTRPAMVGGFLRADMDAQARAFLAEARRDLRASGYKRDSTWHVYEPAVGGSGNRLRFRKRVGPDETNSSTGWSNEITYNRVADGTFVAVPGTINKYTVELTKDGVTSTRLKNVADLTFTHITGVAAGADTIILRLELLRPNSVWTSSTPPPPIRRVFEDRVQLHNQKPPP